MDAQKLIDAIFARQAIWDQPHPVDHVDEYTLRKLWSEVATEMSCTVEEVQDMWQDIGVIFRNLKNAKVKAEDSSEFSDNIPLSTASPAVKSSASGTPISIKAEQRKALRRKSQNQVGDTKCSTDMYSLTASPADKISASGFPISVEAEPRPTLKNLGKKRQNQVTDNLCTYSAQTSSLTASPAVKTAATSSPVSLERQNLAADAFKYFAASSSTTASRAVKTSVQAVVKPRIVSKSQDCSKLAIKKEKLEGKAKKASLLEKKKEEAPNEDLQFFDSLLPHVKRIKPNEKLLFRNAVQVIVQNYAYGSSGSSCKPTF